MVERRHTRRRSSVRVRYSPLHFLSHATALIFLKGESLHETQIASKSRARFEKGVPTILTCIGAVGVVATAVLAVKATPKALRLIEIAEDHRHDDNPNWTWSPLTKAEIIKTTWKCYVPAVVTGAATIICIFGANTLNRRQQASLASAYALLNRSYNDYKRKLKELYGKETHDNIMKALAVEESGQG